MLCWCLCLLCWCLCLCVCCVCLFLKIAENEQVRQVKRMIGGLENVLFSTATSQKRASPKVGVECIRYWTNVICGLGLEKISRNPSGSLPVCASHGCAKLQEPFGGERTQDLLLHSSVGSTRVDPGRHRWPQPHGSRHACFGYCIQVP